MIESRSLVDFQKDSIKTFLKNTYNRIEKSSKSHPIRSRAEVKTVIKFNENKNKVNEKGADT